MAVLPPGYIAPPLFRSKKDYADSGRSLGVAVSGASNELCIYPSPVTLSSEQREVQYESNIYLAAPQSFPLRSQLVSDSSVQWTKTREFFDNEKILPNHYRPLLPVTLEGWSMTIKGHVRRLTEERAPGNVIDHYQTLDAAFDLFLLLTSGNSDVGMFGDDFLDWLNRHYISPTNDEGLALADLEQPWRHAEFWPTMLKYASRGILAPLQHFLTTLSAHPSSYIRPLSKKLSSLLSKVPRASTSPPGQYPLKRREWLSLLASFRSEFDGVPSEVKAEEWYVHMCDMCDMFEGDELVIKRIGREHGIGWLEVVGVWGLWGDERLERGQLPWLVESLVKEMPSPDAPEPEELLLMYLCKDDMPKALEAAMDLDPWLGAHLAELTHLQGLIDDMPIPALEMSIRDHCILTYAETILNDPGQWMVAVDYMQTCGQVGLGMADEVLYRVKLDVDQGVQNAMDDGTQTQPDTIIPEHIVRYCQEHKREWVLGGVVRMAARLLADSGRLGEALSYSLSADDTVGVDRIVDMVMQRYTKKGRQSLIDFVNEVPPRLHLQHRQPGPRKWQSLAFLLNYAEFHVHYANEDLAAAAMHLAFMFREEQVPLRWWTTLFKDAESLLSDQTDLHFTQADAYEILRRVEQFETQYVGRGYATPFGSGPIRTKTKSGPTRFYALRMALAQFFARLALSGRQMTA